MIKTIAVIGAPTSMGAAIANRLAKPHNRVLLVEEQTTSPGLADIFRRLNENIRRVASRGSVETVDSARDASWEADIILLAVPYELQANLAADIQDVVTGKIIIVVSDPMKRPRDEIVLLSSVSAAEELAKLLPHARIVKTFSTLFLRNFKESPIAGRLTDVFVAGDDQEAVSIVKRLVREAGFNPFSAGELAMSRVFESMAGLLSGLTVRRDFRGCVGWKALREPT